MKLFKSFLFVAFLATISLTSNAQTSENPWAIAVGADLINLQDKNVESGLGFGVPALSLSRYIGAGFSVGAQYALGNTKNNGVDLTIPL